MKYLLLREVNSKTSIGTLLGAQWYRKTFTLSTMFRTTPGVGIIMPVSAIYHHLCRSANLGWHTVRQHVHLAARSLERAGG